MPYTEVSQKGRGGFARVLVIRDNDSGELFAKKIYDPQQHILDQVGDVHLKRRFKREVRYQSALNHPNIAPIISHHLDDDPPYFIMPLAECALKDELQADATLGGSPSNALFDILSGLEVLHQEGFVHRDLKPANVLKFRIDGGDRFALSDFGLVAGLNSDSSALTSTGDGGGTQNYSAPELIGGLKRATPLADIYSFGAILHDIFGNGASRVPYTELTVPGALGAIVEKCTKTLARRRYQSVAEIREDLYDVLSNELEVFNSSNEEYIVNLLRENKILTDEQWDRVFILLEDNEDKGISNRNIFSAAITDNHIEDLKCQAPELLAALGELYADYIQHNSFSFDYCDVLASRADMLYENGEVQTKAQIAIALLVLGTSHNRWYVEGKFVKMAGVDISEQLAKRIRVELDAQGIDFNYHIAHLTRSINVGTSSLHPVLQQALDDG